MSEIVTVGLDLAKNMFQFNGADSKGNAILRKKLRRAQVIGFFAKLPSCLVAMEACGGAHFWGVNRRHGVTRWQVYDWRNKLRAGQLALRAYPCPFRLAPKPAAGPPIQNLDGARVAVRRAVQIAAHFAVQSCLFTGEGLSQ